MTNDERDEYIKETSKALVNLDKRFCVVEKFSARHDIDLNGNGKPGLKSRIDIFETAYKIHGRWAVFIASAVGGVVAAVVSGVMVYVLTTK